MIERFRLGETPVPRVVAVHRSPEHTIRKTTRPLIRLLDGLGVEGDAHAGVTVKHRSRVARDPSRPNLRQVHFIHEELFAELRDQGFEIRPGELGENVTTRGLDLLALPRGTQLMLGARAMVEVTGLRNPCRQLDGVRPGLLTATLTRTPDGRVVRKSGIMGIVTASGEIRPGDRITVKIPPGPERALEVV